MGSSSSQVIGGRFGEVELLKVHKNYNAHLEGSYKKWKCAKERYQFVVSSSFGANMKLTIASILVFIVLLGFANEAEATPCLIIPEPCPSPTKAPTKPPVKTTKPPVKKTTTKKPPVKKTTTKKPPVKKTTTKKPPVKKTTTKKPPVHSTPPATKSTPKPTPPATKSTPKPTPPATKSTPKPTPPPTKSTPKPTPPATKSTPKPTPPPTKSTPKPTPPPTKSTPKPTTAKPPCGCKQCGPGGEPCPGCSGRDALCKDLLKQIRDLQDLVLKCVCGAKEWMLE
ncbi:salivary glue protein Sgs-3 [Drosophila bipectinata]|uniref:salivary glue protein Sgs-3 n=1 Tax=Drosophila bipectinata TaxID=42026 RepID=UPI001C8AEA84|nr:salivary glue protein Sgs-3 [Drosophila bipectinata]